MQKLNIHEAMNQSIEDSYAASVNRKVKRIERLKNLPGEYFLDSSLGNNDVEIPIVASKRSKEPWLVTMLARDWLRMISLVEDIDHVHTVFANEKKFSIRKKLDDVIQSYGPHELIALCYDKHAYRLVTTYAEDWFTIYREWEAGMDLKRRQES